MMSSSSTTFFCQLFLFSCRVSVQGGWNSAAAEPRTVLIISPHVDRVGITIKSMKPKKTDESRRAGWCEVRSVTNLRLGDHGVVAVTQRGELQALLPLHVALLEELLHAPGGPLVVEAPGLGWVSHVTGVKQEA